MQHAVRQKYLSLPRVPIKFLCTLYTLSTRDHGVLMSPDKNSKNDSNIKILPVLPFCCLSLLGVSIRNKNGPNIFDCLFYVSFSWERSNTIFVGTYKHWSRGNPLRVVLRLTPSFAFLRKRASASSLLHRSLLLCMVLC